MIRTQQIMVAVMVAGSLAGCSRLGLGDGPSRPKPLAQSDVEPLPAAPTVPVTQGAALQPLPPLPGQPGAPVVDPNAPPVPGQQAALTPPKPTTPGAGGGTINRTDLLGSWKVTSSADSCQLSTSLTSWAGGYRASSRGCTSPDLVKISAWVVQGNQVILKGSDGSTAATLSSAGPERFSGTTSSNQPIALSR